MNKLKMLATQATALSGLMDDREKITTEKIIAEHGTITVNAVDMVSSESGEYPVVTFLENPDVFYCGGIVLKKIVRKWIDYCEGGIDEVNAMLEKDPVKMTLRLAKTKDGKNNVVKVTIVD